MKIYYKYSDYLKNKYGKKVYKLPVNIPVTCPNRDGNISFGGCTYCCEQGAGFECLSGSLPVKEQLKINMQYIKKKYKAEKFIAYFQNYSNTYMPIKKFIEYINSSLIDDIVEISISTRPDCINDDYLEFLKDFKTENNINITIELGLQSANYHTLEKINRGHGLAEYIDSCYRIKHFGLDLCTHVILNLPWDNIKDVIETSKIISSLKNNHVKMHALYIMKNTKMAEQYEKNEFEIISYKEYIQRVITFLQYLSPEISIQRIIGRAPEKDSVFVNWNMSWRKILNETENIMENNNIYQGMNFNYLNGSALKKIES